MRNSTAFFVVVVSSSFQLFLGGLFVLPDFLPSVSPSFDQLFFFLKPCPIFTLAKLSFHFPPPFDWKFCRLSQECAVRKFPGFSSSQDSQVWTAIHLARSVWPGTISSVGHQHGKQNRNKIEIVLARTPANLRLHNESSFSIFRGGSKVLLTTTKKKKRSRSVSIFFVSPERCHETFPCCVFALDSRAQSFDPMSWRVSFLITISRKEEAVEGGAIGSAAQRWRRPISWHCWPSWQLAPFRRQSEYTHTHTVSAPFVYQKPRPSAVQVYRNRHNWKCFIFLVQPTHTGE
jgi:hypothetical protein